MIPEGRKKPSKNIQKQDLKYVGENWVASRRSKLLLKATDRGSFQTFK
jgi:hypothetical protein